MKILIKVSVLILGTIIFVSCWSIDNGKYMDSGETGIVLDIPSYNLKFPTPSNAKDLFVLRQNYPKTYHAEQSLPWTNINFKENPEQYMRAVLNYCLEGNEEVDFKIQDNKIRNWYHAPWLHDDGKEAGNGREHLQGLTRERASSPGEIHEKQDVSLENWAVSFYNEPGGYTIGKIWANGAPDPSQSKFPEGTVSFKLLFTDGTVDKVPFLAGTKEWTANIYPCNPRDPPENCQKPQERVDRTVRLIQIDFAVKDSSAEETGWVFGTFIYDASRKGNNVWEKMAPVGLSWGDDSSVNSMIDIAGAFINEQIQQSYLNRDLVEVKDKDYTNEAYMRHYGLGGRLNGPVDNPVSSCISCHARAAVSKDGFPMPLGNLDASPANYSSSDFERYFSTIKGGANIISFDSKTYTTTDYSLQIAAGIRNYYKSLSKRRTPDKLANTEIEENIINPPIVTRGEK